MAIIADAEEKLRNNIIIYHTEVKKINLQIDIEKTKAMTLSAREKST